MTFHHYLQGSVHTLAIYANNTRIKQSGITEYNILVCFNSLHHLHDDYSLTN